MREFENWHRFYNPSTGRYLEPDPLWEKPDVIMALAMEGQTDPVYAYAGNNPVNWTDATGLATGCVSVNGGPWSCTSTPWWEDSFFEGMSEFLSWGGTAAGTILKAGGAAGGFAAGMLFGSDSIAPSMLTPAQHVVAHIMQSEAAAEDEVEVEEEEDDIYIIKIKTPKGDVEIIGEVAVDGSKLIIKGAHIQGPGANTVGVSDLRGAIEKLGKAADATEVIVLGGERTTGARPGHVPRPIVVKIPR